jgi:uncharacterized membrane protein
MDSYLWGVAYGLVGMVVSFVTLHLTVDSKSLWDEEVGSLGVAFIVVGLFWPCAVLMGAVHLLGQGVRWVLEKGERYGQR